jgi:two-component system LytT family sensor kinase
MPRTYSREVRYWQFQIGGWGLLVLSNLVFLISIDRLDANDVERLLLGFLLGICCTHLMRSFIVRYRLLSLPLEKLIPAFLLLTLCFAIVGGITESWIRLQLGINIRPERRMSFMSRAYLRIFNGFTTFLIWNLLYYVYHFVESARGRELDRLRLQHEVKELELKTLRAHINPHFLFNALNSIRSLIDHDPPQAREAVTMMSRILRSSLQSETSRTVPLERELDVVSDYLALERMRFEDRLRPSFDIDPETLGLPVPPMMLQTLVENGIKHGIARRIDGGTLSIRSRLDGAFHEIVVSNSGQLDMSADDVTGFGVRSTSDRLSILFGDDARFSLRNAGPGTVEACVRIPLQEPTAAHPKPEP